MPERLTMKDIEKSCNCKHAKWQRAVFDWNGAYIVCKKKQEITDPEHCAKCKDRESVRSVSENG